MSKELWIGLTHFKAFVTMMSAVAVPVWLGVIIFLTTLGYWPPPEGVFDVFKAIWRAGGGNPEDNGDFGQFVIMGVMFGPPLLIMLLTLVLHMGVPGVTKHLFQVVVFSGICVVLVFVLLWYFATFSSH